jgi:putative inorganic carbon (HCO3(-)) transporter
MYRPDEKEDYQTVSRSRPRGATSNSLGHDRAKTKSVAAKSDPSITTKVTSALSAAPQPAILKRGHALSFAALFLFTIILYARPAEFYPSPFTNYLALAVGLVTLTLFAVTQIVLEGTPTARPPEVNLVLLFVLTALLSIPLAIDPAIAWREFSGTYIRGVLIFVVIVNVVRTEARLNVMLLVAVATALVLSSIAINDYRLGLLTIEGYRAAGHGTGLFGNTNDMALHLVTMLPISISLFFNSRMILGKVIHAICAAIMMSGILLSFSRGAFLGMLVVFVFFAFKLVRGSKLGMVLLVITAATALILLAPSGYGTRLLSIFIPGLDPGGSADSRRGELIRSAYVALRHPLLGVGMGNYQPLMSLKGLVTHNSYTQVAAEMGLTALVLYTMFIVAPFRKLSAITRETFGMRKDSRFYYLALGLQASLLAFMVSSFFLSVAYSWNVYYLVGYAVCFRRLYEAQTGKLVVIEKRKDRKKKELGAISIGDVKEQPAIA